MTACCRISSEAVPRRCELPSTPVQPKCRVATVSAPVCQSAVTCAGKTMSLALSFVNNNATCCSSCTCYGDPHCDDFAGQSDTWITCDARVPLVKTGACAETKAMCLKQLDNNGDTCAWQASSKPWDVALQGARCVFANKNKPPTMLMYAADNFSLALVLGERSVITTVAINDTGSGSGYILSAYNCMNPGGQNPWRPSPTATAPLPDPSWLPYTFQSGTEPAGDVIWTVATLPSRIDVVIRCTRTLQVTASGAAQYGEPRINVEQLAEPKNYKTSRANPRGFCANGTIAKPGSHANTDYLEAQGLCQIQDSTLNIAKVLCSKATTSSGVASCQAQWCSSVRTDLAQCLSDIATYGWDRTFCAAKTVGGQQASACVPTNLDCTKCVNDIADFGWPSAVKDYANTRAAGSTCVTRAQLPKQLLACQGGVSVQYQTESGAWTTYLAVPSFATLCGGAIAFDSAKDPLMFLHVVRVQQCSLDASCLPALCQRQPGFNAAFSMPPQCLAVHATSAAPSLRPSSRGGVTLKPTRKPTSSERRALGDSGLLTALDLFIIVDLRASASDVLCANGFAAFAAASPLLALPPTQPLSCASLWLAFAERLVARVLERNPALDWAGPTDAGLRVHVDGFATCASIPNEAAAIVSLTGDAAAVTAALQRRLTVAAMPNREDACAGAALERALATTLASRQDGAAPAVALVVLAADATAAADEAVRAAPVAAALRRACVHTFAVGLDQAAALQLEAIAGSRDRVAAVSPLARLASALRSVARAVSNATLATVPCRRASLPECGAFSARALCESPFGAHFCKWAAGRCLAVADCAHAHCLADAHCMPAPGGGCDVARQTLPYLAAVPADVDCTGLHAAADCEALARFCFWDSAAGLCEFFHEPAAPAL